MLGNAHFYNRTIRKIVVAFGTVFNDIFLVRYTKDGLTAKETFKVPLNWGAKEKPLQQCGAFLFIHCPNLIKILLFCTCLEVIRLLILISILYKK